MNVIDQIALDQIADERDKAQQENKQLKDRIKRLEEAGDEIIWAFCPASVSMMTERESDALRMWNKAKEAKP